MGLEEFFNELTKDTDVKKDSDSRTGKIGDVTVLFSEAYDHKLISIRDGSSHKIELDLVQYKEKDIIMRLGLPSIHYNSFLEKLPDNFLAKTFKEKYALRDFDQGSEKHKFYEMAQTKDIDDIKEVIYKLFSIEKK